MVVDLQNPMFELNKYRFQGLLIGFQPSGNQTPFLN
jgi:hypothetical protein